jgi:hypothetical protein
VRLGRQVRFGRGGGDGGGDGGEGGGDEGAEARVRDEPVVLQLAAGLRIRPVEGMGRGGEKVWKKELGGVYSRWKKYGRMQEAGETEKIWNVVTNDWEIGPMGS